MGKQTKTFPKTPYTRRWVMKGLVRVVNETSGEKAGLWSFLEEKPANQ